MRFPPSSRHRQNSMNPSHFAHASYGFRMIDRFLYWGDHHFPKSGKTKGSCQPPLVYVYALKLKRRVFHFQWRAFHSDRRLEIGVMTSDTKFSDVPFQTGKKIAYLEAAPKILEGFRKILRSI